MEFVTYIKCDCGDEHGLTLREFQKTLVKEYSPLYEEDVVDFSYHCTNCKRLISIHLYPNW